MNIKQINKILKEEKKNPTETIYKYTSVIFLHPFWILKRIIVVMIE